MKEIGSRSYRHYCPENGNHFNMVTEDGKLDYIEVGDILEESWTIIAFGDLCKGLETLGYKIVLRKSRKRKRRLRAG